MKNAQRIRESLLGYLEEEGVQFSQVSRDELQGKAVVEFAFNLGVPPSILWGSFRDKIREIICFLTWIQGVSSFKRFHEVHKTK
jgi:hypothetical protein